jgi:hypothetical protein
MLCIRTMYQKHTQSKTYNPPKEKYPRTTMQKTALRINPMPRR